MGVESVEVVSSGQLWSDLKMGLLRSTEAAALACGRMLGKGDQDGTKAVAATAMLDFLEETGISARVVLGPRTEGGLSPGSVLGRGTPVMDLAVYPVEGASLVARGLPNALSIIAAAPLGAFAQVPPVAYMDKLVVGPRAHGILDLEDTIVDNLLRIAFSRDARVSDLTVAVLDRPRHHELVEEIRVAGARIMSLADGDIAGALLAATEGTGVDCAIGVGGAQEAIVTAAAMRCLGGDMRCRLWPRNEEERVIAGEQMERIYAVPDLILADADVVITGISGGPLLDGVRYGGTWLETSSLLLSSRERTVRHVRTRHAVLPRV